jgi:hypothetical protein
MNPAYLSSALDGATIPNELIIQLPHAWGIVTTLLALCCGLLWFLTRSVMSAPPQNHSHDAARPGPGFGARRPPRPSRPSQPRLQPLAHHGSRAA